VAEKRKEIVQYAIPVNSAGERVILKFVDGRLYRERAFSHDVCKGRVLLQPVTGIMSVLHCQNCNLRVEIPTALDTLNGIAAWFEDKPPGRQMERAPCRYCEDTPETRECPVCHLPPEKDKRSGK